MERTRSMRKCAVLAMLTTASIMSLAVCCLADWSVVVTVTPSGTDSNPIVLCKNDPPISAHFSAIVTDHPPVTDSECYVIGAFWHWSGDVDDNSQDVSITTDTPGTHRKTATATATYFLAPFDTSYPNCVGQLTKSNSATIVWVVLTAVAGEWTNIRTPDEWCPILSYGTRNIYTVTTGPIPPEQSPDHDHGWTWKQIISGKVVVDDGHDVIDSGATGCAEQIIIDKTYTYGISGSIRADLSAVLESIGLGIGIGGGASISATTTKTYHRVIGSTSEYKRYKYELWQPWEDITIDCMKDFIRYKYGWAYDDSETPVAAHYNFKGDVDLKLDAACCPGHPQN
jgi:hypothetical protein